MARKLREPLEVTFEYGDTGRPPTGEEWAGVRERIDGEVARLTAIRDGQEVPTDA